MQCVTPSRCLCATIVIQFLYHFKYGQFFRCLVAECMEMRGSEDTTGNRNPQGKKKRVK